MPAVGPVVRTERFFMLIEGVCAFPITPADAEGHVDAVSMRRLCARLPGSGVRSVGVLGSTGTYAFLTRDERRRALEASLDAVDGRLPVVAGIGALRTDAAIALARDARAAGAAAGLLAAVSYTPLGDDEVFEHVRSVAEQSGLPVCLYDNPSTTGFRFGPALIGRLSRVEGVFAAKVPAAAPAVVGVQLAELSAAVRPGFAVGVSVDWHAAAALRAGAAAWFSVAAGLLPGPVAALAEAVRTGDAAGVERLERRLEPLWALFRAHSSLRVMYAAAEALELCRVEPPRPVLGLTPAVRAEVAAVVRGLVA